MIFKKSMQWISKIMYNKSGMFCLLKICYDFIYLFYITKIYDYSGSIADVNIWKLVLSWILLLPCLVLYIKECDLKLCMSLLMTLSVIPTLSVFWIGNKSIVAMAEITIYWILFEIMMINCSRRAYRLDRERPMVGDKLNNNYIISFIWILTIIATVYFSYKYGKFRMMVRFEDVYDFRLDESNYMSTIEGYLFSWTSSLIIPLCLAVHAANKKWIAVIVDLILGMMSYAIYGNKSIFFQLIVVFGLLILKYYNVEKSTGNMVLAFCLIASLLAAFTEDVLHRRMPIALCQRMFFIPAEAHFYYFDFFQTNPFLLLRQSFLRFFFSDPLPDIASVLIGSDIKYNLSGNYNNLNNGLFSDAYQNFGFIGVLIYPFVIVWLLDILCKKIRDFDPVIKYSLIIGSILYLLSAYLFSWLLTGGFLLTLILVYILKHYGRYIYGGKE